MGEDPELRVGTRWTVERRVRVWKTLHGPDREVMFAQKHRPGHRGYTDFTTMASLGGDRGGRAAVAPGYIGSSCCNLGGES